MCVYILGGEGIGGEEEGRGTRGECMKKGSPVHGTVL